MNKVKLDKRIKEGKRPLTCLDIEQAREFVGKECIFSDKYENFKNLDKYLFVDNSDYSAILSIDDYTRNGDYVFRNAKNGAHYGLILPLEWVKEPKKKYRPFTHDEFTDTFTIGEPIIFRRKQSKRLYEYNVLFIGCCFSGDNTDVVLGNDRFSLETLFNNYEWRQHGSYEWKPFGMEE